MSGRRARLENHVARIIFEVFWKRQICGVPRVAGDHQKGFKQIPQVQMTSPKQQAPKHHQHESSTLTRNLSPSKTGGKPWKTMENPHPLEFRSTQASSHWIQRWTGCTTAAAARRTPAAPTAPADPPAAPAAATAVTQGRCSWRRERPQRCPELCPGPGEGPKNHGVCLSFYLSIGLSIYLSVYLSICLSIYLCT